MLRSRAEGDDDQFYSIALQVAAAEARRGHRQVATEIRAAVDAARSANGTGPTLGPRMATALRDLAGLLELREPRRSLSNVVLPRHLLQRLDALVQQQRRRDWLREYGKTPNRRLLFVGPPVSVRPSRRKLSPENYGLHSISSVWKPLLPAIWVRQQPS